MQVPHQNDKSERDDLEKKVEQQLELSEAWRQLLGLQTQASAVLSTVEALKTAAIGNREEEGVPVLSHDPWNFLAHEQGIQVVDLQQAHVRKAQSAGEESDVEHALDMMQEQEKKPEK